MSHNDLENLLAMAAHYLLNASICEEDGIRHNGRRAYGWTIMRWLNQYQPEADWDHLMTQLASDLYPFLRRNQAGAMILFPGLHERRNYSSNAIDTGIFLDAFHDLAATLPEKVEHWLPLVDEVPATYIVPKISANNAVHNRYLWAGTGLARWVAANPDAASAQAYKKLLESVLDKWLSFQHPNGHTPYSSHPNFSSLSGMTVYYHSRSLAFAWYILEQAAIVRPDIEVKLMTGARFLASMLRPDGIKELALETKRYYFSGPYEVGSHPYDIYVYAKAYAATNDMTWVERAYVAIKGLIDSQNDKGAIKSHPQFDRLPDWQCDIMRTTHLAWLTRVPEGFWKEVFLQSDPSLSWEPISITSEKEEDLTSFPLSVGKDVKSLSFSNLLLIGDTQQWAHFVCSKSPLSGYAGQRASGIILHSEQDINDILARLPLTYRLPANPLNFLRNNRSIIIKTLKQSLWHSWDTLIYKRFVKKSFYILDKHLVRYLFVAFFVRGTEFCCQIKSLTVKDGEISHDLIATNVLGKQEKYIGKRRIVWVGDKVKIIDHIKIKRTFRVVLPLNWHCEGGTPLSDGSYKVGYGEVIYSGYLSDFRCGE